MAPAPIVTHALGYPRMGETRELKFALEKFWRGEIDGQALEAAGRQLRARNWQAQRDAGLDFVTVGDFAYYDHMLNHVQLLGCEPARFGFGNEGELTRYFTMARGQISAHEAGCGCGSHSTWALEMTKWFDTNYHYLVPEFHPDTTFRLGSERLFDEVSEAQALGHQAKAVLVGPLTFLYLGKSKAERLSEHAFPHPTPLPEGEGVKPFNRLDLLERLLPVYGELLARLRQQGVEWVQIDEPILGLDLPDAWRNAFEPAYNRLNAAGAKLLLATYFSPLQENLSLACKLPVAGLHVDAVRAPQELAQVADWLPAHKLLSVGIVDGRNVWRADLDAALAVLKPLAEKRSLALAPSCSLLHVPLDLNLETALDLQLKSWLAFARQKLDELAVLRTALLQGEAAVAEKLAEARRALIARRASPLVHCAPVKQRAATLDSRADRRDSPFPIRQAKQRARFKLPAYPTTTIGSFPQTPEIRAARAAMKRGELSAEAYEAAMKREIAQAVRIQEELGLDVLVHGEAERNDMVEYFGEQLEGFAFTRNGWVQSYGSRCVKPPIIFGDVSRPRPMTVEWARHAQSLTNKPMKGMLTGPVTILQWSFVRDDQPRSETCLQIALAIRDEVAGLEAAGIPVIQIDEPAIREGLPLRRAQWKEYLAWAVRAFRISASGVADETQIHTHMCYSEFNDILPDIAAMDADVITIETSRSDMELLRGFGEFNKTQPHPGPLPGGEGDAAASRRCFNEIGPGVWDIHSPRVPAVEEMVRLMQKAAAVIPPENLWVNPDCGLKTRGWAETLASLGNMVEAARQLRKSPPSTSWAHALRHAESSR